MSMLKTKYKFSSLFSIRSVAIVLVLAIGTLLLHHNMHSGNVPSTIPASSPHTYPNGIPEKFDIDGKVQPFPGNTIICHLSPSSDIYVSLQALYDKLKDHHLSHLYTLLPPSSWHMTVFEGALDKRRRAPAYWPADLDINTSLSDCTAMLGKKLQSFDSQLKTPFSMSIVALKPLLNGISLHLEAPTPEGNKAIRHLRDRLTDLTTMKQKNHSKYKFHLSVAYLLRFLSEEQEKEIRDLVEGHLKEMPKKFVLGVPEFCKFDDMFAFERIFYLQHKGQ